MAAQEIFKLVGRILIENADALEAIDGTTEAAKALGETLEGTGKSADDTSKKIGPSSKFGTASVFFGNMLTKFTDAGINLGKVIGKTGFGYNANMEKYLTSYTALLGGNSEAAQQLITDIEQLASVTPMNTEGLIKNAGTLIGTQKVQLEDVVDTLRMLGDVAKGDQNYLDGLVRAYSQIMSAGKLNAEDLNQMADREVPIWSMVADYMDIDQAYLRKLVKNTFVPAEVITETLKKHTSEGGMFYQQMEKQAGTFIGKMSTLEDNAVITTGKLMESFFEVAKSDVLPRMMESLDQFSTWASENKDTITKMAEAVGKFATISFDAVLDCFKWMTENGEAVAVAIGAIGTAMGIAAVSAHPYAAAVTAVAGALMLLNSEGGQKRGTFDHMFDGYTNEQLQTLNAYVDALNELNAAEDVSSHDYDLDRHIKAGEAYDAALQELLAIENLYETYNTWHSAQAGHEGANGPALKVQLRPDDNAEADMQADIDQMAMDATVELIGDTSGLQADVNRANLTARVGLFGIGSTGIDGSHANGLDYVPYDGYIAKLHKGESVLTSVEASAWRGGSSGNVESLLSQVVSLLAQQKNVVLDSGAVVGQLAPAMDARLGTISSRKGRRN